MRALLTHDEVFMYMFIPDFYVSKLADFCLEDCLAPPIRIVRFKILFDKSHFSVLSIEVLNICFH